MQIFARPTYDRIAKHVLLQDESVRLDILKAFTGMDDIVSAELLEERYNPLDPLRHLRTLLRDPATESLFKDIKAAKTAEVFMNGKKADLGADMLRHLSGLYEEIRHELENWNPASAADFLCDTPAGYVAVRFQTLRHDSSDDRALAYIAGIYGYQLRQDQVYGFKDVIGVSLLAGGSAPYRKDGGFVRDYRFADHLNPKNRMHAMRLVRYSLGDAHPDDPALRGNERLRQWIEFFKSAPEKDAVPPSVATPVRKAYEMVRVDILKKEHPELLNASDEFFASLTEHDRAVKEAGMEEGLKRGMAEAKAEIARNLLAAGKLSDQEIADVSGLSPEDLRTLKREENL